VDVHGELAGRLDERASVATTEATTEVSESVLTTDARRPRPGQIGGATTFILEGGIPMTNDYIRTALAADRQNTLRAEAHIARRARQARPSTAPSSRLDRVMTRLRSDRRGRQAARSQRAVTSQ